MLSGKAVLALVARDARIDHHRITWLHGGDLCADVRNNPGAVGARYMRELQREPRKPTKRPEIQVVQRRGLEGDEDIVWASDFGIRHVSMLEHREITVAAYD
jgi:hypothetical protein